MRNTLTWVSPTVYRQGPYRFFFFSREEPRMHVHVVSADGEAKFWLKPAIVLARNYKYSRKQLREICQSIEEHYDEVVTAWKQHFGA